MDINLGFIEGISYIDTPYFTSVFNQKEFFRQHLVDTISSTFYPPHYTNVVRFDIDDVPLDLNINYLWFEYSNKVYYYFIKDITYVNESIIELSIVMDVIQTYMFNIIFSNGIIERMFINRWNDNDINRNYIRENVSDGLFSIQETNFKQSYYWLVVKVTEPDRGYSNQNYSSIIDKSGKNITLPYVFYVFPMKCSKVRYMQQQTVVGEYSLVTEDITYSDIKTLLSYPSAVDAYIIKDNPFPNILDIVMENNEFILTVNSDYKCPSNGRPLLSSFTKCILKYGAGICVFQDCKDTNADLYIDTYTQNIGDMITLDYQNIFSNEFTINNTINTSFLPIKHMPVLLDENYIRIEYGDGGGVTTYPVSRLTDLSSLKFYKYCNIDDGSYTYAIIEGTESLYTGLKYESFCLSNLTLNMPLYNDTWKEYQANNRGRWITAGMGAVKNAIEYFGPIAMRGYKIDKEIHRLSTSYSSLDKRYKNNTVKSSVINKISRLDDSRFSPSDFNTGDMPITRQIESDYNAFMAPDSIRQAGDAVSAIISSEVYTKLRILKVLDIEQCGHYYHRNGYKVDRYVNELMHPFRYVQNRYYFNIIKMGDVDLHLWNIIEDENNVELIKNRLLDGVRLWNVENNVSIGDFTYDNVELDYLE